MTSVDSRQSRSRNISIKLEKIQDFDAKTAFDNWKKLGITNK